MSYQSLAFFTGLFGSIHCVAMCGPLVMAMPFGQNIWVGMIQKIVYQLGRILTYSALGFAAGSIGNAIQILGAQRALSFISGVLLLLIAFNHFSFGSWRPASQFYQKAFTPIARFMGQWMSRPYGGLVAGVLHGLIPCGMVYMAIIGSLNSGSPLAGSEFMFFFGLGTTPLLMLSSLIPILLRKMKAFSLLIPTLYIIAGTLLISRSLNLNIRYLSIPVQTETGVPVCN